MLTSPRPVFLPHSSNLQMCDSLTLNVWTPTMTEAEYERCRYPYRELTNLDDSTIEFRAVGANSPLTGAGFLITPIGVLNASTGKRMQYGRIAGYRVEINVPACIIGHNRILVNSVYKASIASLALLKFWLVLNGCTRLGIDNLCLENSELIDVTPTFLFQGDEHTPVKQIQAELRDHAKAVMNRKRKDGEKGRDPAFTYPFEPEEDQPYTLYIKQREFSVRAYIKQPEQENAFLLPIEDNELELEVETVAGSLLRIENSVHGKWLKQNDLSKPVAWRNNSDAYALVFNELRRILRLDVGLRDKILKKTTVPSLPLSERNKTLLLWHIDKKDVLDHPILLGEPDLKKKMAMYYSAHDRIWDAVKIDIYMNYETQIRNVKGNLSRMLVYPGEYQISERLKMCVFSRASVDVKIETVHGIIRNVLEDGPDAVPPLPSRLPKVQLALPPQLRSRGYGISNVPVYQASNRNEFLDDDAV